LRPAKRIARWGCAGVALILTCCGCSGNSYTPQFQVSQITGSSPCPSGKPGPPRPGFSLSQISNSFSAMPALERLASQGGGSIAVILPDASSGRHFGEFDAPYLEESFRKAGLKKSQFTVQNAPASTQFTDAKAAIRKGASVLVLDARYSGLGVPIESYAKAHCVQVIDYDYLTLGGARSYYVGFDSLKIGVLMGQGLANCVSAWKVRHPHVIVMKGGSDDYNSAIYAQGYDAILARKFGSGWKEVGSPAGTWNAATALSEFQQAYAAHHDINAALIPNDDDGMPIIQYLRARGIKAWAFPTTGLDATVAGLQNVLAGYQCGTVYKPIFLEAQAAAALAMYVRAGVMPPSGLLNGSITDPQTGATVASVLLDPEWVTAGTMKSTVIADGFVPASQLCAGQYAKACAKAGIPGGTG
jgi:D-xylose transport system substrate-binding protein